MVTGLYPESHGIVDNSVFDLQLSSNLEKMRTKESDPYYGGEPIWSVYKRLTGRPAHCLFWVGCYHNNTGYKPDVSFDYNQSLSLDSRIETLLDWLRLPKETRPGLINAYLHQPDEAGHNQKSPKDVDDALAMVDEYMDKLFTAFHKENLLECINLVIVSDHGMQPLNRSVDISGHVKEDGLVVAKGVVTRIQINDTCEFEIENLAISASDLGKELYCTMKNVKVNTKESMPVRKHYSNSHRIGDFILEGRPGATFDIPFKGGDHGYDYHVENMHTIMFARGPAFKKNSVAPAFQNVQYMNLWLTLLGIEGALPNNGTVGFFDSILEKAPKRENKWESMGECDNFGSSQVLECQKIPAAEKNKLASKLSSCPLAKSFPVYSKDYCYQSYCENTVMANRDPDDCRKAVIEVLNAFSEKSFSDFSFLNTKYSIQCPFANHSSMVFFSAGSTSMSKMADAQFVFPAYFQRKILGPLQQKTQDYTTKYKKLYVISGLATDTNRDGHADQLAGSPTHFYRILIRCLDSWVSTNPPACKNNRMRSLAFIFPILDEHPTLECMDSNEILLDYTATISDVEQIAGFEFQLGSLSPVENVHLRRNITFSLW
uniref:Extracellular Endonuclease subunit A domain-containing protein n=1 Tax=Caenorhabditis japonica TaxID=281687 RepID=A0A8R1HXJ0_CAEJA